jgi:hypothetical protein
MPRAATGPRAADTVGAILENYASRGVFRGFARGPATAARATFKILWHHGKFYDVVLEPAKRIIRMPRLLPDVPAEMHQALRGFLAERSSEAWPAHRRIDPAKAALSAQVRAGHLSLSITARDGDFEYATRKLIHTVHEIFLEFLSDGRYYEYLIETFDLDPDKL